MELEDSKSYTIITKKYNKKRGGEKGWEGRKKHHKLTKFLQKSSPYCSEPMLWKSSWKNHESIPTILKLEWKQQQEAEHSL